MEILFGGSVFEERCFHQPHTYFFQKKFFETRIYFFAKLSPLSLFSERIMMMCVVAILLRLRPTGAKIPSEDQK